MLSSKIFYLLKLFLYKILKSQVIIVGIYGFPPEDSENSSIPLIITSEKAADSTNINYRLTTITFSF